MANLVEQMLHVAGPQEDLERFCTLAQQSALERHPDDVPQFMFKRVCPVRPQDGVWGEEDVEWGDLFQVVSTRTYAIFKIVTRRTDAWHFFQERFVREWPTLSFCCAINEDMRTFGGVIAGIGGVVTDLVKDYSYGYNARSHAQRVRYLNRRWADFVCAGRPWKVQLPFSFRLRAHFDVDAVVNESGCRFQLCTEDDCRRFVRRRRQAVVLRRNPRTGQWRKVRALCKGDRLR